MPSSASSSEGAVFARRRDRESCAAGRQGLGPRPVVVTISDETATDHGLLLFTAFVVRGLAADADSAAAAGATTAATGGVAALRPEVLRLAAKGVDSFCTVDDEAGSHVAKKAKSNKKKTKPPELVAPSRRYRDSPPAAS